MPARRSVLATLGAALLAGCTTGDTTTRTSPSTPEPSTTASTTGTNTTTSTITTPTATLEEITAMRSFVYLLASVHPAGYISPDTTFVFARASAAVDRDDYALVAGDIEHPARREIDSHSVASLREGVLEGEGALLAFVIEGAVVPADATIHGPGGTTAVPTAVREILRHPPSVTVTGFQVPEQASRGSTVTVTLTLRNHGGSAGTFRGNVGSTELSGRPVQTIDVPAETTRTEEYIVSLYGDGDTETIRCAWGVDSTERTIELTD